MERVNETSRLDIVLCLLYWKNSHMSFLIVHEKVHDVTNLCQMESKLHLGVEFTLHQFNQHQYEEVKPYQNRFTLY